MADISSDANGNPTLTGSGTEDALHVALTTADVYQYMIDLSNMAHGDVIELRIEVKVRTGSTAADILKVTFANVQTNPVWVSPPIPVLFEVRAYMTQELGTGRAIEWTRVQYAA